MSSVGWHVVLAIDARERREQERLDALHWERYRNRLAPDEIDTVRAGKRATFTRPVPPPWVTGTWLDAGPKMRVKIKEVRFIRRGVYLIVIANIEDFRGGGRLTNRPLRELQANSSTTIDPLRAYEPEPEKVPPHVVENLTGTKIAQIRYERTMAERRLAHEALPLEVRLAIVRRDAEAAGVDVTRQLASVEQRIRATEAKVRRLSERASDRAA